MNFTTATETIATDLADVLATTFGTREGVFGTETLGLKLAHQFSMISQHPILSDSLYESVEGRAFNNNQAVLRRSFDLITQGQQNRCWKGAIGHIVSDLSSKAIAELEAEKFARLVTYFCAGTTHTVVKSYESNGKARWMIAIVNNGYDANSLAQPSRAIQIFNNNISWRAK